MCTQRQRELKVLCLEKQIEGVKKELRKARYKYGSAQTEQNFEVCVDLIKKREELKRQLQIEVALIELNKGIQQ